MDGSPRQPVYELCTLLEQVSLDKKVTLRCVEALGTDVYVGTSDGKVLQYGLEAALDTAQAAEKVHQIALGRAIDKIVILKSLYKAAILAQGTVTFYNLPGLSPTSNLVYQTYRNVTSIISDRAHEPDLKGRREHEAHAHKICLLKKQSIVLIMVTEQGTSHLQDIPLPETHLFGELVGAYLCIADQYNYSLVDLRNAHLTPLLPVSQVDLVPGSAQSARPLILVIDSSANSPEFLIISSTGTSSIGIFVNAQGDPIRGTLEWASHPKSIALDSGYVLALLKNHTVEVHHLETQLLQQVFPVSEDSRGLFMTSGMCFGDDRSAIDARTQLVNAEFHRSQDETSWTLQIGSLAEGTNGHGSGRQRMASIALLLKTSLQAICWRSDISQLESLIDLAQIDSAMTLLESVTQRHVEDPSRSKDIQYMMQRLGLACFHHSRLEEAKSLFLDSQFDIRMLLFCLLPDLPSLTHGQSVKAFRGILNQLDSFNAASLGRQQASVLRFLVQLCEAQRNRPLSESSIRLVDNSLLNLYAILDQFGDLDRLLSLVNACSAEQCHQSLEKSGRHYALSLLYKRDGQAGKAFETWRRLFDGQISDAAFDLGIEDFFLALRQTQDSNVVLENGLWLCSKDEDLGLQLFFDSENKATAAQLDSAEVLANLRQTSPTLARRYVEYLVLEKGIEDPSIHSELVFEYFSQLQALCSDSAAQVDISKLNDDYRQHQSKSFVLYLCAVLANESSVHNDKQVDIVRLRLRLCLYLHRSKYLDTSRISGRLELLERGGNTFAIEKALVFARTDQPTKVLEILVALGDIASACRFCQSAGTQVLTPAALRTAVDCSRSSTGNERHRSSSNIITDTTSRTDQPAKRALLFNQLFECLVATESGQDVQRQIQHLLGGSIQVLPDWEQLLRKVRTDWPLDLLSNYLEHLIRHRILALDSAMFRKSLHKQRSFIMETVGLPEVDSNGT